jgi:hypothetical protein
LLISITWKEFILYDRSLYKVGNNGHNDLVDQTFNLRCSRFVDLGWEVGCEGL